MLSDLKVGTPETEELEDPAVWKTWQKQALDFLNDAVEPVAPPATFRVASRHFLLALDALLRNSTGRGLEAFCKPLPAGPASTPGGTAEGQGQKRKKKAVNQELEDLMALQNPAGDPLLLRSLPELTLCMDQGSVGFASHWLSMCVLRLNAVCFPDTSHRVWNDAKLAVQGCPALYDALCCTMFLMNMHMGPFESYAWWSQAQASAKEFHRTADWHDPLWQAFLPAVLRDLGEEDRDLRDEDFQKKLWGNLPTSEAFTKKDVSVGMTRWFGWQHSWPSLDRRWHSWLTVLVWLGLRLGSLKKGMAENMLLATPAPPEVSESGDVLKASTNKTDNSNIGKLRTKCRNTVHVATVLLMDDTLQRRGQMFADLPGALSAVARQAERREQEPPGQQSLLGQPEPR